MTNPTEPEVWVTRSNGHEPATGGRAWVPLLRKLRAAGWEREPYGVAWSRNRHAQNQERIDVEEGVASIEIGGVALSGAGLSLDQTDLFLLLLGAFKPAPEAQWRHSEIVDMAVNELVRTVVDSAFGAVQAIADGGL